ncbi:hypothetical protein [Pseudomonas frederiksbergensis]|nr:hypothetical protein [Pseudomonas frederiksbergensis]
MRDSSIFHAKLFADLLLQLIADQLIKLLYLLLDWFTAYPWQSLF